MRRLLDHSSHQMVARYARLSQQTIRAKWEAARKVDIRGREISPPDGPLADAQWMKNNLARAKMALPNGWCGLPLQQRCEFANACLTCPMFLTTAEFLPEHRRQLEATRTLITRGEANGHARLAEMNRAVEKTSWPSSTRSKTAAAAPVGVAAPAKRQPVVAMRADNSACLLADARRRRQAALDRAAQTLQRFTAAGEPVTLARFAAAAGVSRSWLYTQPELLDKIAALPQRAPRPAGTASVPASQRASTASLQRRLELAHQRIRQLSTENERMRAELARAYGQIRASPARE